MKYTLFQYSPAYYLLLAKKRKQQPSILAATFIPIATIGNLTAMELYSLKEQN